MSPHRPWWRTDASRSAPCIDTLRVLALIGTWTTRPRSRCRPALAGRTLLIGHRSINLRGAHRLATQSQRSAAHTIRSPRVQGGRYEKAHLRGVGTYCERNATAGRRTAGKQRAAQSTHYCVRSCGVRRLPRRNRSTRIPARSTDVAAVRCQRKEVSSHRRDGLDSARSADESVVNERKSVWLFERFAGRRAVARARDANIPGGST